MASPDLAQLAQLTVNGLANGSLLALAATGLTLIYGILRLTNFAQGEFLTLGAYFTLVANSTGLSLWVAMPLGAIATIALCLLGESILWEPLRRQRVNNTTLIILTIGLSLLLRNLVILIWGAGNQAYRLAVQPALTVLGLRITLNSLLVILGAAAALILLHLVLQHTAIGKGMRAIADDPDLARVSGVPVETVIRWTWVIAGGLTAIAGGLYGLITAVRPTMGWNLILPLFASAILGGIGSPYGAIAGGLILGLAQELSTYWLPAEYKLAVAFVILIAVLLIKPQGLFAR
ncbi:branched-chain amino acid ABC transporter permease [Synechococcus elongatus IITB7]|uniref:branched-chain amino acid ABC transporter permease n=1 Tax=Synechococcus elongatus TaxID=32046 RepID=UPI0030D3EF11